MNINDGWGDDPVRQELGMLEVEEYLRTHEGLVRLKVADRLRGSDIATDVYADLCNEARITAWQVLAKRPDAPPEYVSASMSMRIRECLVRGTWTGLETHRGKQQDPLRRPMNERQSVDDETSHVDELADGASWLDEVIVGYHHGEIVRALNALTFTQRVYCYQRFWEGRSNPEIAVLRGVRTNEVERQWRVNIRPRLREELGRLATM